MTRMKKIKHSGLRFDILTIFPDAFSSYFKESLIKRALAKKTIDIRVHNLRDFTEDRHHKVDDRPFGGGPGMVIKIEPIFNAVKSLKVRKLRSSQKLQNSKTAELKTRVILFSTRGREFNASVARRLARYDRLILICGRYEGVDERVAQHLVDEEISMGDYILSGGELPAMVLVEAISRFLPGFLGKYESLEELRGSYPVYTRPEVFYVDGPRIAPKGLRGKTRKRALVVPRVLLEGDHAKINAWRRQRSRRGA